MHGLPREYIANHCTSCTTPLLRGFCGQRAHPYPETRPAMLQLLSNLKMSHTEVKGSLSSKSISCLPPVLVFGSDSGMIFLWKCWTCFDRTYPWSSAFFGLSSPSNTPLLEFQDQISTIPTKILKLHHTSNPTLITSIWPDGTFSHLHP